MAIPNDTPFPTSQTSLGAGLDDTGMPRSPSEGARSGDDVLARVVHGAHETIDRLAETAAPHVQRLSEGTGHMREVGDEWTESLRTTVRENPLAAVATALAIGMLVARITR